MPNYFLCYVIALPITIIVMGVLFDVYWRRNNKQTAAGSRVRGNRWQLAVAILTSSLVLSFPIAVLIEGLWGILIVS